MPLTLSTLGKTEIASPPGVYFQLKEIIEDPDGEFDDIAKIISGDPPLAARLLKIVNSPFYGLMAKVESIPHALGIIGSEQLSELALATAVVSKFDGFSKEEFDIRAFWTHSLGCGFAGQLIAEHINYENPERMYLAGMLHDIGQLVLLKEETERYTQVISKLKESSNKNLTDAENSVLRFNHAQIGGVLLNEWKLPQSISTAVSHHHEPLKAKRFEKEAAIIHVSEILLYDMGLGGSSELDLPTFHKETLKVLELTPDFINDLKTQIQKKTEEAVDLFF